MHPGFRPLTGLGSFELPVEMVESWEIKNPFPSPYGVRFFRTKYIINNNEIVEFESFRPLTGLGSFELEPEFPELLEPLERFRPLTGLGSFELEPEFPELLEPLERFRPLTGLGSFELEPEFPELLEPLERFRPLTGLGSFEQSTSGNPIVLIEQKLVSVPLRG